MALNSEAGFSKVHVRISFINFNEIDCLCPPSSLLDSVQPYPTVDDTFQKLHVLGKHRFLLDLLDLSGLPEYERFRAQQYRDADVFILCYSIDDRSSFDALSLVSSVRRTLGGYA